MRVSCAQYGEYSIYLGQVLLLSDTPGKAYLIDTWCDRPLVFDLLDMLGFEVAHPD